MKSVASGIERLAADFAEAHGCHTVILYGSHARGDATANSDVDLLGVRESGAAGRDARMVDGVFLDGFVYPEEALATLDPSMLRVLGGVVLRERDGLGTGLLARIQELHDRGPKPLPDDERQALVVWSRKMIERFRGQHGVEARFRRMSLVIQALEDYFLLRNAWFRGPKEAFAWLLRHDRATHALFEQASRPEATEEAFEELARSVYWRALDSS